MVGVRPDKAFTTPVSLATIKNTPALAAMALLRQSRLSVSPVTPEEWEILLRMGD
jgi:predicted RNA-binding protein with PUA-like domain